MKKSSLLALSLASLVGLVGCNKDSGPGKTNAQKCLETVFSFLSEGEFVPSKAKETMTPVFDGPGYMWDYENGDLDCYYKIEGTKDVYLSVCPMMPLYAGESEGTLVIHWSDEDQTVTYEQAALYSANLATNMLCNPAYEGPFTGSEWGYVQYWYAELAEDEEGEYVTMYGFDETNAEDAEHLKGKVYAMWATYVYFLEEEDPTSRAEGQEEEPVAYMVMEFLVGDAAEMLTPAA